MTVSELIHHLQQFPSNMLVCKTYRICEDIIPVPEDQIIPYLGQVVAQLPDEMGPWAPGHFRFPHKYDQEEVKLKAVLI